MPPERDPFGRGWPQSGQFRITVSRSGPAHAQKFEVEVRIGGLGPIHGRGGSRQQAEKAAAESFLKEHVRP